jgi:Cft2 family RNA processing exonuclease
LADISPLEAAAALPADVVFCSHAHADQARGLLPFHQAFPQIPIYASEVTARLLPLNWLDSPHQKLPQFCQPLPWRSPIQLFDDLTAELFPAGHLPGAAAILLTYRTAKRSYRIFYTGDFSLSNLQLVEGLSLEALRGLTPDVLIVEGSYGTARHPHRRQQEKQLVARLDLALKAGQNVLLPVPTLGLGQEILKLLRSHHQFTGRDVDIWVAGSTAIACDLYLELLERLPATVQNFAKHQPLFWDERICPRLRRLAPPELPTEERAPYIVLAGEAEDLQQYCPPAAGKWLILIAEPGTPFLSSDSPPLSTWRQLPHIESDTYLFAEHSDGRNTTQLIHNLRPQHVIFVHGSPTYLADLTSLEELQSRYQLHSPAAGTLVELPIGEKFMQPALPAPSTYEGELNELATGVTINLSDQIIRDPRWSRFADTGLVEARWQGEELVLRGVSQRELRRYSSKAKVTGNRECCQTCRHFKNQQCWNLVSPLYGFKVMSEGYCPVFEPLESEE